MLMPAIGNQAGSGWNERQSVSTMEGGFWKCCFEWSNCRKFAGEGYGGPRESGDAAGSVIGPGRIWGPRYLGINNGVP